MLSPFNFGILIIGIKAMILIAFLDFCIKYLIRENARYFLLHTLFNTWITIIVYKDAFLAIMYPLSTFEKSYEYSAILSTTSIATFHIYHIFAYSDLTLEDWLHHLVSSILVAAIGTYLPFGKCPSLANLAMCGIPGGIDYLLLVLVKINLIDKINEKFINRYLNLIIRWPIMFLTSYIFILNIYHNKVNMDYWPIMFIGLILHCYNAIYYCDKVIGNYYVRKLEK
ncbi:hypothetical protein CPAV1605_1484 [seawater metagenome]|uniref:TLC domain-containing protein n=1 Tax=seawater metagenome TaxID=1561972 RepID=A0A5E8CLD6_9ZZZZ